MGKLYYTIIFILSISTINNEASAAVCPDEGITPTVSTRVGLNSLAFGKKPSAERVSSVVVGKELPPKKAGPVLLSIMAEAQTKSACALPKQKIERPQKRACSIGVKALESATRKANSRPPMNLRIKGVL